MKKALALIMAIAMIASMAAVSMAATVINPADVATDPVVKHANDLSTYSKSAGWDVVTGETVPFGKTLYVVLFDGNWQEITDADAVKGLKVDAKWEKNGNYISDVEIVKVGATGAQKYAVAIETTGSSLSSVNVLGEIAVKGQSYYEADTDADGKLEGKKAKVDLKFEVELDLGYVEENVDGDFGPGKTPVVYDFDDDAVVTPDEVTITFGELTAEVETKNMKKVLMSYNSDENEELLDAYVDADLLFINCEATFRRTAEVTVDATDYPYFYEIVDGALVAMDAEYDDWTEEFTFKTRTLGNYVLSDTELVVEEVVVTNPATGAAA